MEVWREHFCLRFTYLPYTLLAVRGSILQLLQNTFGWGEPGLHSSFEIASIDLKRSVQFMRDVVRFIAYNWLINPRLHKVIQDISELETRDRIATTIFVAVIKSAYQAARDSLSRFSRQLTIYCSEIFLYSFDEHWILLVRKTS